MSLGSSGGCGRDGVLRRWSAVLTLASGGERHGCNCVRGVRMAWMWRRPWAEMERMKGWLAQRARQEIEGARQEMGGGTLELWAEGLMA